MKKDFIIVFIILIILSITACGKKEKLKINGQWNILSLEKDGVVQQVALSYITFQAKGVNAKVSGDAGVNSFSGTVKINKDGSFKADDFAVTKMMGEPAAIEFEDMFLETLSKATAYYIEDSTLVIKAPEAGLILTFVKAK